MYQPNEANASVAVRVMHRDMLERPVMRPLRTAAAVSAATTAALLLAAAAPLPASSAAVASGADYAALGDSYSAGLGAGDYLARSGGCRRSANAYPELWAARHAAASFAFQACKGATTGDVLDRQLGALGSTTRTVSLTVGGNDAAFAQAMADCVLGSEVGCADRVHRARAFADSALPGLLDRVYSAIRARAPRARVVVLGYPRLYGPGSGCLLGLSAAKQSVVDDAADDLDAVIARRAAAHGFTFADVRPAFSEHEICSAGPSWLHGLTYPVQESYHPTAEGQADGYLPVLEAATDG